MRARSRRRREGGRRTGAALVAALALLALASALLAGSFAASMAAARATRSASSATQAQGAAHGAVASVLGDWGAAESQLAIGASLVRAYPASGSRSRVTGRTRVHRLSAGLYVVSSDLTVGDSARPGARRRARLLVVSAPSDSVNAARTPTSIRRWALSDVY
jgi:hypothetical protein